MRVALICNYPVDPSVVPGGVTAVAHYLVRGLTRVSDVDLHVVCCQPDVPSDFTEERDGARIHFLATNGRFAQLLDERIERRRIARVLERIRPDLAHSEGLGLPTAAVRDSGLPHGVTLHGITWKEAGIHHASWIKSVRGRVRARRHLAQMLWARNVFVTSGYAAEMLPAKGNYRQFVINNPIGDAIFALKNEPSRPHVLFVGGTRHRKDPMTAIRAFEEATIEIPEATMHVIGPPSGTPFDREIDDYIRSRNLAGRVRILGLVPDSVLHDEYRKASLLLLTSIEETAPIALGEAHAIGIPSVGTNAGGIPWMIRDGETGFVRPVGDVPALADRVRALLVNDELRTRMAASAKRVGIEEFSLDEIARKTILAWEQILAG